MIEIVPVGAIVTTWAFRIGRPPYWVSQTLPSHAGKLPRVSASRWLAFHAASRMNEPMLVGQFECLFGVVADVELEEQVGETHHAQADLPGGPGRGVDLRSRILIHFHDVVEEPDGQLDCLAPGRPSRCNRPSIEPAGRRRRPD